MNVQKKVCRPLAGRHGGAIAEQLSAADTSADWLPHGQLFQVQEMQAHIQKKRKSHRHEVTKWGLGTQNHGINATFLPTAAEHCNIVLFSSYKKTPHQQVCQQRRLVNLKSKVKGAKENCSSATLDSTFQDSQKLLRMSLVHLPAPEEKLIRICCHFASAFIWQRMQNDRLQHIKQQQQPMGGIGFTQRIMLATWPGSLTWNSRNMLSQV